MKYYNVKETASRIRDLRIENGYTQTDAAAQMHIDRRTLGNAETGKRGCSVDLLIRISELYSVSLDYLVLGRDVDGKQVKSALCSVIEQLSALRDKL
jgi:transcriptional regulator with XRE-family HTH domain